MGLGEIHNGAIADKWEDKWLGLQELDLDFKKIVSYIATAEGLELKQQRIFNIHIHKSK